MQEPKNLKKKNQQVQPVGDLYLAHLIQDVDEDDFGVEKNSDVAMDLDGSKPGPDKQNWRLRFEDVPEPGKRTATLRMVENTDIREGDAQAYMEGLGYK